MSKVSDLISEYNNLGISEQLDYDKLYLYSLITHSTAIEGSTVSETENRLLFDEGLSSNKPMTEQLMNLDLKAAYDEGLKLASDHADYSVEMLCSLSALVMRNTGSEYKTIRGCFDSSNGDLRMINVSAGRGGKSYMAWEKIPARLGDFCNWLNQERKAIDPEDTEGVYQLSFLAHHNLVFIHPWADGNGRMSRLVMNMIQHEFGAIPSIVNKENRVEYIDCLSTSQDQRDPDEFIRFMFNEHVRNLSQIIEEYKRSYEYDTLYLKSDTLKGAVKLSSKERAVMDVIAKDSEITIEEIMKRTGFSRPTVTRAISSLKKKGLLERVGARKNGVWMIMN